MSANFEIFVARLFIFILFSKVVITFGNSLEKLAVNIAIFMHLFAISGCSEMPLLNVILEIEKVKNVYICSKDH